MLPDHVVMAMLKRELLLTRAKLHALHYEHIMGERKMRTYKSQLKQARRPMHGGGVRWRRRCMKFAPLGSGVLVVHADSSCPVGTLQAPTALFLAHVVLIVAWVSCHACYCNSW